MENLLSKDGKFQWVWYTHLWCLNDIIECQIVCVFCCLIQNIFISDYPKLSWIHIMCDGGKSMTLLLFRTYILLMFPSSSFSFWHFYFIKIRSYENSVRLFDGGTIVLCGTSPMWNDETQFIEKLWLCSFHDCMILYQKTQWTLCRRAQSRNCNMMQDRMQREHSNKSNFTNLWKSKFYYEINPWLYVIIECHHKTHSKGTTPSFSFKWELCLWAIYINHNYLT